MLIDLFRLDKNTAGYATVSWTAENIDYIAYPFIQGKAGEGPLFSDLWTDDQRFTDLEFYEKTGETAGTRQVEIHEVADESEDIEGETLQTIYSVYPTPNAFPVLYWSGVDGAIYYKIYHKETVDGDEELLNTVYPEEDATFQSYEVLEKLNGSYGVWHFFRIEAVSQYKVESVRESWRFWIYDTPDAVSDILVSNGSGNGLFDIELVE